MSAENVKRLILATAVDYKATVSFAVSTWFKKKSAWQHQTLDAACRKDVLQKRIE